MTRKAVLLDVDGTLIQSNSAHAAAWSRALHAHGYEIPVEQMLRWIGMGGDKILKRVDPQLDAGKGTGAAIGELRQRLFLEEYAAALQPTNGAKALLERLRAAGLVRAIATSAKKDELDVLLRVADIADCVDVVTTSDDVSRSKPDSDIVHAALEKAESDSSHAIYLGDTPYDVEAAHRAGVPAVVVRSGVWSDAELRDADAIYDDPSDLCEHFNASPLGVLTRR